MPYLRVSILDASDILAPLLRLVTRPPRGTSALAIVPIALALGCIVHDPLESLMEDGHLGLESFDVLQFYLLVDGPGDMVDESAVPELVDQSQGFIEVIILVEVL